MSKCDKVNKSEEDSYEIEHDYENEEILQEHLKNISKLPWGKEYTIQDINFPLKSCSIVKNKRFSSYIFRGYKSKNLLKEFMKYDEELKIIVQILDSKGKRQFIPFKSWEECWKSYLNEPLKCRSMFELILSHRPCKPYLDIEWILDDKRIDARYHNFADFVDKLNNDLFRIFKDRYNIDLDESDILIMTSHSERKASFHIVINSTHNGKMVAFKTNRRREPDSAWDLYNALIEIDEEYYKDKLDEAVYSLDREFRVIYSNKTNCFRPLISYNDCLDEFNQNKKINVPMKDCLKYVVSNVDKNPYLIKTDYVKSEFDLNRIILRKSNNIENLVNGEHFSGDEVPDQYSELQIVKRILELVKYLHPTAFYTGSISGKAGWRFSYEDRLEKCYTGNYHDNNGFYVYYCAETDEFTMYCYSMKCRSRHILGRLDENRKLPEKVNKIKNKNIITYNIFNNLSMRK